MVELKLLQPFARWLGRQQFIRFGIRDRLARAVDNPNRMRGHTFRQAFFGGEYEGCTGNFIDWSARYFGAYAREELDLFADLCGHAAESGGAVIDVGANVGHHSLFYALQGFEVFSFEPNPAAMELLMRKLEYNPILRIHPFQRGLSDRSDRLALSIPDHTNLGTSSLEKAVGPNSVAVEVCCGDQMLQIQQLQRVDWIKIDVEGHEIPVLVGLRHTIAKHRPPVFFEWNGVGCFADVVKLFPENYSLYSFLGDQNFAGVFARPGYRLHLLRADADPGEGNMLAWPSRQMPERLSHRVWL